MATKKKTAKPAVPTKKGIAKRTVIAIKKKTSVPVKKKYVRKKELPRKKILKPGNTSMQELLYGKEGIVRSVITETDTPNGFTFDVEGLNDQQVLFAMRYVEYSFNGARAAKEAGYSEKSAREQASVLLTNPNIQALIERLKKDIGLVIGVSAYKIAREYAKIGFANVKTIFKEDGSLLNPNEMPEDVAANISSIQIDELTEYQGKDIGRVQIGFTKKLRFFPKVDALDKLARMIGADGVTKVANTDKDGNDVQPPLSDSSVDKLLDEIRKIK